MYAAKILGRAERYRNADGEKIFTDHIKMHTKAALIGAGIGLVVGYQRHYSLLISAIVGAGAATVISHLFYTKMLKDEE